MSRKSLIKDESELQNVADLMHEEIKKSDEPVVARCTRVTFDAVSFFHGMKTNHNYFRLNTNKEKMESGIYTQANFDDLNTKNYDEITVSRDLQERRFNFNNKAIPLPTKESSFIEPVPTEIDYYDSELEAFAENHKNTRLTRTMSVEQRVIVNSNGGKFIQSIPFLEINYSHGYTPIPTTRDLSVVCTSNEDVKNMTNLIPFIADPTLDKKIKNSTNFTDAFHHLHEISSLKFGSLEESGIKLQTLYDIGMITGVPMHEIFGHQFEIPLRYLDFGESSTFKQGQKIFNNNIVLSDNPRQSVGGFKPLGFTHFDSYGRVREPVVNIQNGQIKGFLGSEYSDPEKINQYLGGEDNFVGNASQYTDGLFPMARMSCTVIDGPTENVDLEGKLLVVAHNGATDPRDKTYRVDSYESYIIRDGEALRLIPLQITGGINNALESMTLLNDTSYQTGMCGKPEPVNYAFTKANAESPVSQFAKSQIWGNQQVYPLPISDRHLKILFNER